MKAHWGKRTSSISSAARCTLLQSVRAIASRMRPCTGIRTSDRKPPVPQVTLHQFEFPFSGQQWNSFLVGRTGSISFGKREKDQDSERGGRSEEGVSIGRFEPLAEAAGTLIDSAPAICVFFKPRMSGPHYVKELADRVVITWDLTEPFGNIQDFTWFKTINRFQAVLYRNGSIEMSYKELAARDAIVGVYPALSGAEKSLADAQCRTASGGGRALRCPESQALRSLMVSFSRSCSKRADRWCRRAIQE